MWDNPERSELDPAECRGCPQALQEELFFRFILHRFVTVAAKSGQFTAGETEKGQFL